MNLSRRRLPHQYPENRWLFVTCHLHGSLPNARYPPPGKMTSGQAFIWMDRYLDTTRKGPMYLKIEKVATVVIESLQRGVELGHFDLGAWLLMANHVHVLLWPKISVSRLLCSLKGVTAREANRILGGTGSPFWQAESYDHWVRDDAELAGIWRYIENNPVKAGIVARPENYRWSSAGAGMSPGAAGTSACATA